MDDEELKFLKNNKYSYIKNPNNENIELAI